MEGVTILFTHFSLYSALLIGGIGAVGWYVYGIRSLKGHIACQLLFLSAAFLFSSGMGGVVLGCLYSIVAVFIGVIWGMVGLMLGQLKQLQEDNPSSTASPSSPDNIS